MDITVHAVFGLQLASLQLFSNFFFVFFFTAKILFQTPNWPHSVAIPFVAFVLISLEAETKGQSARCEICRQPVTTFFPNRLPNAALGLVHDHCKWCGSKITLNQPKDHLERCPELEVSCQQCRESIKQKEMDARRSKCLMMDVVC